MWESVHHCYGIMLKYLLERSLGQWGGFMEANVFVAYRVVFAILQESVNATEKECKDRKQALVPKITES